MKKKSNIITGAVVCLVISLGVIILICSFLSAPIADDWSFYGSTQKQSIFAFLDNCMHHTGRIGQWLLIYGGFKIFGMAAVRILPAVMFIILGFLFTWLIVELKLAKRKLDAFLIGFLVVEVSTLVLPSMFDSFLWYDSAATGYASILAIMLVIDVCIHFIKKKPKAYFEIPFYFIVALASTFSELTSLVMIGGLLLAAIVALIMKKRDIYRYVIPFCATAIVGFLVLYFSPGSIERRAVAAPEFSLIWIFVKPLKDILYNIKENFTIWEAGLVAACCIYSASKLHLPEFWQKKTKLLLVISAACLVGFTYGMICVNNYVQDYIPYRVYTLPVFGAVVSLVVGFTAIKYLLIEKTIAIQKMWYWAGAGLIMVVVMGSTLSSSSYILKLSLRRQLVNYRDASVAAQRDAGNTTIQLVEAPSLVLGNAEDIYYYYPENGQQEIIWVGGNYADYMGVSDRNLVLVAPPEMYQY